MAIDMKYAHFFELETPDGETYLFNTNTTRFVWGVSGVGLPDKKFRIQNSPHQVGASVLGVKEAPRIIIMTHRRKGNDIYDYWTIRRELLDLLRYNRQNSLSEFEPVILKEKYEDRTVLWINAYIDTSLLSEREIQGESNNFDVEAVVRFICYDPIYYNPDKVIETGLTFHAVTGLVFPLTGPIVFGGGTVETDTITYNGKFRTYPTITITGPARNPKIVNLTISKKIELDYNVASGESVSAIITENGIRITTSLGGADLIGVLTPDSDPDFLIVPDPIAPGGVNSLGISAALTTASTNFAIEFFDRYPYGG